MPTSNEQSKQPSKPRKSTRTSKSAVATATSETEVPLATASEGNGASVEAPRKATTQQSQQADDIDGRIRQRAYEIYLARGYSNGNELDDWFEAERQLRASASETKGRASDDDTTA